MAPFRGCAEPRITYGLPPWTSATYLQPSRRPCAAFCGIWPNTGTGKVPSSSGCNGTTDVLGQWPHCLTQDERAASLALVGAVREFLHGASAVKKEHVKNVTGLSYADAEELMEKLLPR